MLKFAKIRTLISYLFNSLWDTKIFNFCWLKLCKDQCDTCAAFKVENLNMKRFDMHRKNVAIRKQFRKASLEN